MTRPAPILVVAMFMASVVACQRGTADDTTVIAVAPRETVTTTPAMPGNVRPMAERSEALPLLDSARTLLSRADTVGAARLLHQAAAFFLIQASVPPSRGTPDLLEVSSALDSLAGSLVRHQPIEPTRLRRISAHANLAEAERHTAIAAVAWSTRSKESVCDELAMAADHIERAAVDARMRTTPSLRRVLDEVRAIVTRVPTNREADLHDLDEPFNNLYREIGRMHERLVRADATALRHAPPATPPAGNDDVLLSELFNSWPFGIPLIPR